MQKTSCVYSKEYEIKYYEQNVCGDLKESKMFVVI